MILYGDLFFKGSAVWTQLWLWMKLLAQKFWITYPLFGIFSLDKNISKLLWGKPAARGWGQGLLWKKFSPMAISSCHILNTFLHILPPEKICHPQKPSPLPSSVACRATDLLWRTICFEVQYLHIRKYPAGRCRKSNYYIKHPNLALH